MICLNSSDSVLPSLESLRSTSVGRVEARSWSWFRSLLVASTLTTLLPACGDDEDSDTSGTGTVDTGTSTTSTGTTTGETGATDTSGTTSGGSTDSGGSCEAMGLTTCPGGLCVDTQTDPSSCGACGNVCNTGEVCVAGACSSMCPAGQAKCDGGCVDPNTDADHCGVDANCGGGQVCGAAQTCQSGGCVGAWSETEMIHQTTEFVSRVRTAVAEDGSTQVLWVQSKISDTSEYYNVWGRRFDAALGTWAPAAALETQAGSASEPSVAVDAAGRVTAVWLHWPAAGGNFLVQSAYYDPTVGAWAGPVTMSEGTQQASFPSLAVDPAGMVHASWLSELSPGVYGLVSANFDPAAGAWSVPVVVQPSGVGPDHSLSAAGGRALLVWQQQSDSGYDVYGAGWSPDSGWQQGISLESATEAVSRPQAALGNEGEALVAWLLQGGPGGYNVYARSFNLIQGALGAEVALTDGPYDSSFPKLAINAEGRGTAVWLQSDNSVYNLHAATWDPVGYAWSASVKVDELTFGSPLETLSVSVDAAGYSTVAWPEPSMENVADRDAMASRLAPGTAAWTPPQVLDQVAGEVSAVAAASSAGGHLQTAWWQTDGTNYNIYGTRLKR